MKRFRCFPLLTALLVFAWLSASAPAQVAEKANEGYKTKEQREGMAKTLGDPHRDERQKPRELVEAMGLAPGETVIDLGTGVGYMLPYLSHAVGATGRVIAEDIQTDFLDKARTRATTLNLKNVTFVLGSERDPKLPGDTANSILVLDVYHHFDYPEEMLGHIRDCLQSDGKLVIVDYYKRPDAMPNGRALEHIRLDEDDVIKEVEANGFRLVSQHEHLPKVQYMAIFVKK
jgi:ubiquinone/menaquinone biosynthesis C-methylase UbiE